MGQESKSSKANQTPVAVLCGLGLFFGINMLMLLWQPLSRVNPETLPSAHTWTYWATKEFNKLSKAPDVVICGSSVMMHPIARVEAEHKNENVDYVLDHKSTYLADKLRETLNNKDLSCYSFALPGSMVSDDYMVVRSLLLGDRKPSVIVLGLTLRDFIDSGVTCPGATPPFRYLKRYTNIDEFADLAMPQIWQRMDYWLGKLVYFNGKKMDLQTILSENTKNGLDPIYKKAFAPCKLVEMDPTRNTPANLRGEIEAGMMLAHPVEADTYLDNTAEYRKRYKRNDPKMFEIQSKFLDRLLSEANAKSVKVVIVNIPVSEENHTLMPPGMYEKFKERVSQLAAKHSIEFVDPSDQMKLSKTDFYDSVHMNASGGRKLLDQFAAAIVADKKNVAQLQSRAQMASRAQSL